MPINDLRFCKYGQFVDYSLVIQFGFLQNTRHNPHRNASCPSSLRLILNWGRQMPAHHVGSHPTPASLDKGLLKPLGPPSEQKPPRPHGWLHCMAYLWPGAVCQGAEVTRPHLKAGQAGYQGQKFGQLCSSTDTNAYSWLGKAISERRVVMGFLL